MAAYADDVWRIPKNGWLETGRGLYVVAVSTAVSAIFASSTLHKKAASILMVSSHSRSNRVTHVGIRTEVRVTLVGIRTEVSRHFKEIIALGFGTCRLGCPAAPGDLQARNDQQI